MYVYLFVFLESDTRRKAATDLVQSLQEQFEAQTVSAISTFITQFLQVRSC
jgi:hypothetical protein